MDGNGGVWMESSVAGPRLSSRREIAEYGDGDAAGQDCGAPGPMALSARLNVWPPDVDSS